LTPNHNQGWLPSHIDRAFELIKRTYGRMLGGTLKMRPAVYAVWITLTLLIAPMYMFSPNELAPNEDQGVVFGAIDVPANATLEQLTPYTEEIQRDFAAVPEFDHSFQITFPAGGFGGAVMKPWGTERKRTIFPIQEQLA